MKSKPDHYGSIVDAVAENRDNLAYAWRILNHGVCDGCALGTTGMADWTLDQVHLCNVRLRLLRLNTAPAMDAELLADLGGWKENGTQNFTSWAGCPTRCCAGGAKPASSGSTGTKPSTWCRGACGPAPPSASLFT